MKAEIILHVEMVKISPATCENIYANPKFRSALMVITESADLNEVIARMEDKVIESQLAAFQAGGSGWTFGRVEKLVIQLNEYKPL